MSQYTKLLKELLNDLEKLSDLSPSKDDAELNEIAEQLYILIERNNRCIDK